MLDKPVIAIVGGGAAGMMAAISAVSNENEVLLFERNPVLGKKIRITGKGRCNVTNNCTPEEFMQAVNRNSKFLYSSIYKFTPEDAMKFFENLGVPLKTERGRRVFPESDKASDIAEALIKEIKRLGVKIINARVSSLLVEDNSIRGLVADSEEYKADAVILATGGVSYTGTGSDGDGHRMAKKLDHKITDLTPSLIPVNCKEDTAQAMGLSLKNVVLDVYRGDKNVYSELGEMLFTHFGVSGPLVLSASAHMQKGNITDYRFEIDLKPALSDEMLDKRVLSDFQKYSTKDFINSLNDLLPKSLIPSIIKRSGISERKKCCEITKEERRALCNVLKHYSLTPTSFRPINEAIITCGGIAVSEINPGTLMSKKTSGLFFAGEIIDVDAYTGGYNLQIAWATGKKAGESAISYITERI